MRTITLLFFMLFTIIGFSQKMVKSSDVKTTYEEYNYLTERYGLEDNATMLNGYELQNFMDVTMGKFNYNYKLFVETNSEKTKAVFITITKIKKKDDKIRYLCMPINNGELFKQFISETENLGISMSMGLDALNKALLSKLIDEKFNSK